VVSYFKDREQMVFGSVVMPRERYMFLFYVCDLLFLFYMCM